MFKRKHLAHHEVIADKITCHHHSGLGGSVANRDSSVWSFTLSDKTASMVG